MKAAALLVMLGSFSIASNTFAHPGKTDAYGCHFDKVNGGFHCHAVQNGPSKEDTQYTQNKKQKTSVSKEIPNEKSKASNTSTGI